MTRILAILREPELSAMAFERLGDDCPGVSVTTHDSVAAARDDLATAEVLVTIGPMLGDQAAAAYRAMPALRWIQSIGTGTDNLAGHPALAPDVAVSNVRGLHGAQMSEAAIAAMLTLARDVPRLVGQQAARVWDRFPARLLAGSTVGILGMGLIAEALAPRLKALGMTVVGISAAVRAVPGFDRVVARDSLHDAVADLDWLVLLVPHAPATHHIIDAGVLAAMKPTACLINLSRGGVLDDAALLAALQERTIAGAALDVFEHEPLPADHPLWSAPNLILTPHVAGYHTGYAADVYAAVRDNVIRYRSGGVAALANRV